MWEVPNDNGGQRIESYDHQWRYSGDAWAAGNLETTEGTYRRITVANDTTYDVQARVRARNSVGVSGWAGTVTVDSGDLLIALPTLLRQVRPNAPQTVPLATHYGIQWSWTPPIGTDPVTTKYNTRYNALAGDAARDIILSGQNWYGGLPNPTRRQPVYC